MPPADHPTGLRAAGFGSLGTRLLLALLLVASALGSCLLWWLVPATTAAFQSHGDLLLREGSATMRSLVEQQTIDVRTVLVDLIEHSTTARQRALADLPLELYGAEVGAIRAAVAAEDRERGARQQDNVQRLARELIGRAERTIAERLQALDQRQQAATAAFVDHQHNLHLGLVVATFLVSGLGLGFGLLHLVVRPVARLRQATRRVAAGDLAPDLPPPGGGELGELARDFTAMLDQLRSSRQALRTLNDTLASEVQKQTAHLEQALADLQSSHQQLAKAERLASLGTLAGGIAHEFHNVIGGIRGCAGELLADETQADRRDTLQVIQRAADRATGIVQQLLRFARRSVDRRGPVDLAEVAGDALRLCEPAARRQNVTVRRELPAGLRLVGDADGLHQVVVNLLTNALQAMPDGGTLAVVVAERGADLVLQVADTGVGIAPEHQKHLFEPFFTTKTAGDHTRAGTGLGLSVSYGIVTAHGGRFEVTSAPGRGTTFAVVLPKVPPSPPRDTVTPPEPVVTDR